jgi:hypothetical protein
MLAGGGVVGDAEPTLLVRITTYEDDESQRFRLRWEDGGKNRASRASEEAEQIHVPAGGSRVVEAPPRSESDGADPHNHGVHRPGTLVLSGDAHEFDNRLHVASQPPRPVRILYLGGTDASDAEQPLYYLNRALRQTRRSPPVRRTPRWSRRRSRMWS